MIELTEEQKKLAQSVSVRIGLPLDVSAENDQYDNFVKLLETITLPQIKQLAEQHNASVVQWVKFNADDESTYPNTEYTDQFITNIGCCAFTKNDWVTLDTDSYYTNRPANYVTHWTYLPIPKVK